MKCLIIAEIAKIVQIILNQIRVGMVFIVDDQIRAMLDAAAKI